MTGNNYVKEKGGVKPAVYLDVAVALPVYQTFTYAASEAMLPLVAPGKRVLVPFRERTVTGYILGETAPPESIEVKPVRDILDESPLFPEQLIPLFRWVADYYFHPLGEVIRSALPGGLTLYDFTIIAVTEKGRLVLEDGGVSGLEAKILEFLKKGSSRPQALHAGLGSAVPRALLHEMERKGWVEKRREFRGSRTRVKYEPWIAPAVPLRVLAEKAAEVSPARAEILGLLVENGPMALKQVRETVPTAARLVPALVKNGLVRRYEQRVFRDPFGEPIAPDLRHEHNADQKRVIETVGARMGKGFAAYLLAGVTGSGKTEVYLTLAQMAVRQGGNALVLVPEIALISQMERAFRARFGEDVAVLHSGLSSGERLDEWTRIARGRVRVAIGARSAIFAPFPSLRLIVVDEEHDASYKQESRLRYNARVLAVVRARFHKAVVLLGSATPSVQSIYNAETEKYHLLTMPERIHARGLPDVTVVDLKAYRDMRGMERFFSPELKKAVAETLDRGEQVLLFLNRRGFSTHAVCAECGLPVLCEHCDITLTFHQTANAYRCHYCGFSKAGVSRCAGCGGSRIRQLGFGTEKVESYVSRLFPEARVARMDRDTTARKGALVRILRGLREGTVDILVGTQMVAKGHDFPNITLVGVICADLSLNFPDFRAGERTFQVIAQVAGRAGRGEKPGRVILQTYNPEHFCITSAMAQDYEAFYRQELAHRRLLGYPPFSRMVRFSVSGKDRDAVKNRAAAVAGVCRRFCRGHGQEVCRRIEILGPMEAPLGRIAERYRYHLLVKSPGIRPLRELIHGVLFEQNRWLTDRRIKLTVDMDPFFMM